MGKDEKASIVKPSTHGGRVSSWLFGLSRAALVLLGAAVLSGFASLELEDGFGKHTRKAFGSIGAVKPINGGAIEGFFVVELVLGVLMFAFNKLGRNARNKELIMNNVINALGINPSVQDLKISTQIWRYLLSFLNEQEKVRINALCSNIDTAVNFNDPKAIGQWADSVVNALQPMLDRNNGIIGMMNGIATGACTFLGHSYRVKENPGK